MSLLAVAVGLAALTGAMPVPHPTPRVLVASGLLQGVYVDTLPRGGAFLGIPYAAPPVGRLRWRAPQPVPRWAGVREAAQEGPACPQTPSGWLPEMLGVRKMQTDEACLTLDVWTPEIHAGRPLPVLVWVHGGGNVEGASTWPPLGERLAERGVVVVSINYRLGALGFLALRELSAEPGQGGSGNYGQLDQVAALHWVRANIAKFGGDPGAVTIGGQSSGGLDICNLMASPLARGLFERAILQSGVCVDSVYPSLQEAEANGERFAGDLGVTGGAGGLEALRAVPVERILQTTASDGELDFEPTIDGRMLPRQPAETFAQGEQMRVPVLVGTNANEVTIFASPLVGGASWRPKTVTEYQQWVRKKFGAYADEVLAEYPARRDGEARAAFEAMDTDFDFVFGAWLLANDTARIGEKAFLYDFTYVGSGPFAELGAFHSEESMFLSGRYWSSWVASRDDGRLAEAMVSYWVQFIRSGDPNGAGLPVWPAYERRADECQELGRRIGARRVGDGERFGVFRKYLLSRLQKAMH